MGIISEDITRVRLYFADEATTSFILPIDAFKRFEVFRLCKGCILDEGVLEDTEVIWDAYIELDLTKFPNDADDSFYDPLFDNVAISEMDLIRGDLNSNVVKNYKARVIPDSHWGSASTRSRQSVEYYEHCDTLTIVIKEDA